MGERCNGVCYYLISGESGYLCPIRLSVGHSQRGRADNAVERRVPHRLGQPVAVTRADTQHRPLAVLAHPRRRSKSPAHAAGELVSAERNAGDLPTSLMLHLRAACSLSLHRLL